MILVTGAAGQVGRAVVGELRGAGLGVLETDVAGRAICCDIRDAEAVRGLFLRRSVESVVHLAAVLPTAYRLDPGRGWAVNVGGTKNLILAAGEAGVKRFVFASSASVYGNESRRCSEDAAAAPEDGYGEAKILGEQMVEQAAARGMATVALRIARVIGPGAGRTGSAWRSQMFERAGSGQVLDLPFRAGARISVIPVEDLARAVRRAVEAPGFQRRIYNAPAEIVEAGEMAAMAARFRGWEVRMGEEEGGPEIDGGRWEREFGFTAQRMREYFERG